MAGNANFDAILSTTLANYRDQLTDNVFSARPLTYHLMDKGRIRLLNGGTKIVEPLIYGENSTVKPYSGYDLIDLTPQQGISAAEFEWKQYAASIAISGIEEAKNNGEQEVINLLEAKIMQAEESMREGFNRMFYRKCIFAFVVLGRHHHIEYFKIPSNIGFVLELNGRYKLVDGRNHWPVITQLQ